MALCSTYMYTGLYRLAVWETTNGTIVGVVIKESTDDFAFHEKARFTDPSGNTIDVISFTGVDLEEDARTGDVTILYNPSDPIEAVILQGRDYLILLFIPFTILLMYLGWPFTELKATKPTLRSAK